MKVTKILNKATNVNRHILTSIQKFGITTYQIKSKCEPEIRILFNPITEKAKFDEAFRNRTKFANLEIFIKDWINAPIYFGWWNVDRDVAQGSARYICGGAYPNKIADVLFRSKVLQLPLFKNLAMKFLNRRAAIEYSRYEEQPKITTNSVFLYKNNSNYFINRRSFERFFICFYLIQGVNFSGFFFYMGFLFFLRVAVSIK